MKFPLFNLDIFKRSSSPTNRSTKTFGKRKSSSTHRAKSGSSSHRRTSRKRSITYYSPSKSRFYPTEYFPTLQQLPSTTVSTDVATTSIRDGNAIKLNQNRTFLCSDQDVIVHHDATWLPQHHHHQSHQNKQIDSQFYTASELYAPNDSNNNNTMFGPKSTMSRDYNANGIVVGDNDNAIVAATTHFDRYTKECVGMSSPAFVMPNSSHSNGNFYANLKFETSQQQQQQQPSFHRTAAAPPPPHQSQQRHLTVNHHSNSSGAIGAINNINSLYDGTMQYTNSSNDALFHHSTMPIMKKHERHRRRKVCVMVSCSSF